MNDSNPPNLHSDFERVPADLVMQASAFASSILADVAGRRGAMNGRIAPLSPSMRFAGCALTVEVRPGDNLMIHAALAVARPGDVLVVDGKADLNSALMGEIMVRQCRAMGIVAVVLDGAARDSEEIRRLGFPMYCVGTNPNGPTKSVAGLLNQPVSVGGVMVRPGDLVVGDADGVVVVERGRVASLLPLAAEKVASEAKRIQGIEAGTEVRPAWLEAALRAAGVLPQGVSI